MKLRLVTLLFVVAFVGVSVGWLAARHYYAQRIVDEKEREREIVLALAWAASSNRIYSAIDDLSESEFVENRLYTLFNIVAYLYMVEENANGKDQRSAVLSRAGDALSLLNVDDTAGFTQQFQNSEIRGVDRFFESDGQLKKGLADFVQRSLEYHRNHDLGT